MFRDLGNSNLTCCQQAEALIQSVSLIDLISKWVVNRLQGGATVRQINCASVRHLAEMRVGRIHTEIAEVKLRFRNFLASRAVY